MKLYSFALSPFAARCRMYIRAKGLDIEILDPPASTKTPEWRALNPIGKVPMLDTGSVRIPESQVICTYLEAKYPEPSLSGTTPEDAAMVALICQILDLYVYADLGPLFMKLKGPKEDASDSDAQLEPLKKALGDLQHFLSDGPFAVGETLTVADCAATPGLFFIQWLLGQVGAKVQLTDFPKLETYLQKIQSNEHAAATIEEMEAALAAWISA